VSLPPDLLQLFVVPLNATGIPYMATGSIAAMIYGEPRLTNDIDLVVALESSDAARLASAFADPDIYVPPLEVIAEEAARTTGGHFNLIHGPTALKADVYPAGADPLHRWALPLRREFTIGGAALWIAPAEYVILRKLHVFQAGGSNKHLHDVRRMLDVSGALLDMDAIAAWARTLGITAEWQRLRGEARGGA
jgi:hypothetical protein